MNAQQGYLSYLGIKKEGTYGSFESPTRYIPLISENFKPDKAWVPRVSELRATRFPTTPLQGRIFVSGGVKVNAYPNMIGEFLATFFGDPQTTNPSGSVYQHIFTPGVAVDRQLSMKIQKGGANPLECAGFMIDELEFSCDNAGALIMEVKGGAKSAVEGSSDSPTYVETIPFLFHHATISAASTSRYADNFVLNGKNSLKLENFKVGGGQYTQKPVLADVPEFGGSFTWDFEDWTDYDKFMAFTDVAISVVYTSTELIEAGNHYTLTFTIPKARYENNVPEVGASGLITVTQNFKCFPGDIGGEDLPLSITLLNGESSYA